MVGSTRLAKKLNHIYMFLFALRFSEAFWVIYLRTRGFSFAAIGLFEAVYHVAGFFAEIPTGIIADRIGRRNCLLIGRITCIITAALMLSSQSIPLLALTFALWSLGGAFHSGAYEALVYDGMVAEGRQDSFTREWGRLNGTYLAGASLAALAGGLVAGATALSALYYMSIGADCLAIIGLLLVREPAAHGRRAENTLAHVAESIRILKENPKLAGMLLFSGSLSACLSTARMYGQGHMRLSGVPLQAIGGASTAADLLAIAPSRASHRIQNRLGSGRSLRLGVLVAGFSLVVVGSLGQPGSWAGRVFLLVFLVLAGLANECIYPIISDRLNAMIPSAQRATVLSADGMIYSTCMIGIFPLFGWIGDRAGLRWSYLGLGVLVTLGGLWAAVYAARKAGPGVPGGGTPDATCNLSFSVQDDRIAEGEP